MIFVDRRTGSVDLQPLLKTKAILTNLTFGDVSFVGTNNGEAVGVGIERKKVNDLINSISTGRLSGHQLPGMLKEFDRCYLIVEGIWKADKITGELLVSRDFGKTYWSVYQGNRKWTAAGVWAYLTSVETFLGVPFRITRDARDTARAIDTLYGWWQNIQRHSSHLEAHKKTASSVRHGQVSFITDRLVGVNNHVRNIALQLPGIDTKISIDVAKKFKSVQEMFDADEKDWMTIPRIGNATASEVMRVLHKK